MKIIISCRLVHETEMAYRVEVDDEEFWVPKSECHFDDGELDIPEWLAISKGIV